MALRVRLRRPGIYLPIETCGEPIGSIQLTLTSTGSQDPLFSVAGSTFGEYVGQQEAITKLPAQRRVVQRMLRHAPCGDDPRRVHGLFTDNLDEVADRPRADPDVQALLAATVSPDRVALVGLHAWTDDDYHNIAAWGLTSFSPDDLRDSSRRLLDWLAGTGCTRVAIHFDVDTIDSDELVLGLGAEPEGLTSIHVQRVLGDVNRSVEVVGLTIAEFVPRQVMHLQQILRTFPLRGE